MWDRGKRQPLGQEVFKASRNDRVALWRSMPTFPLTWDVPWLSVVGVLWNPYSLLTYIPYTMLQMYSKMAGELSASTTIKFIQADQTHMPSAEMLTPYPWTPCLFRTKAWEPVKWEHANAFLWHYHPWNLPDVFLLPLKMWTLRISCSFFLSTLLFIVKFFSVLGC